MPHGTPDWGLVGPRTTTYGLDDLGEHAVRLGSPVLFDRRGEVVWATDFRDGLNGIAWHPLPRIATQTLFAGNSRQGAYCVQAVAGPVDDDLRGFDKRFPFAVASGVGLEFSFNISGYALHVTGEVYLQDVAGTVLGAVRYDSASDMLEYQTGALTWASFTDALNALRSNDIMHTMKLVIDFRTGFFMRVLFDNQEWRIPALPLLTTAVGALSYWQIRISVENQDGEEANLYVDNVIVTQNEP